MTRLPRQRRESAGQALLFDDETTDRVLRDARDPGYVLVGIGEAVHTRHIGTRAAEHAIPTRPDIAATVHQLSGGPAPTAPEPNASPATTAPRSPRRGSGRPR
jgi:hypothetical protein